MIWGDALEAAGPFSGLDDLSGLARAPAEDLGEQSGRGVIDVDQAAVVEGSGKVGPPDAQIPGQHRVRLCDLPSLDSPLGGFGGRGHGEAIRVVQRWGRADGGLRVAPEGDPGVHSPDAHEQHGRRAGYVAEVPVVTVRLRRISRRGDENDLDERRGEVSGGDAPVTRAPAGDCAPKEGHAREQAQRPDRYRGPPQCPEPAADP
ncbi:hypothetical protein [Actinocrinis puniceicyclus]|uniref:hypothetical protein n=1 Tax=Actinocrinis puniceicyclus TaxID=977794 RepID=UPI001B8D367A|nr:hypothetical protein [Actinocrinis puniceicyclus]